VSSKLLERGARPSPGTPRSALECLELPVTCWTEIAQNIDEAKMAEMQSKRSSKRDLKRTLGPVALETVSSCHTLQYSLTFLQKLSTSHCINPYLAQATHLRVTSWIVSVLLSRSPSATMKAMKAAKAAAPAPAMKRRKAMKAAKAAK